MALTALIIWPFIGVMIFRFVKDLDKSIILSFICSYLILPSAFHIDLPAIPPLDKTSIPAITIFALLIFTSRFKELLIPRGTSAKIIITIFIMGQFITTILNSDLIVVGGRFIPGTSLYDAASGTVRSIIFIIPFMIGKAYLSSTSSHLKIIEILVISGIFYSFLMLIEVRLSPQFHNWVYGYFPHSFAQQVRDGGFRPVVFMSHGLYVGLFAMMICVSTAVIWKATKHNLSRISYKFVKIPHVLICIYLLFVLILCKTLGSLVLCLVLLPCVLFLSPQLQVKIAAMFVVIAMTYPLSRGADVFPMDSIHDLVKDISEERAQSLMVRIVNEDQLLARAQQRALFGWGGWGRNRIFDSETGEDLSITDGYWVIVIGTHGWVGFLSLFGLLGLPVLLTLYRIRREKDWNLSPATSGLCLLLAANMIWLLPNSTLFPWTWLIAGALWGYADRVSDDAATEKPEVFAQPRRRTIL